MHLGGGLHISVFSFALLGYLATRVLIARLPDP